MSTERSRGPNLKVSVGEEELVVTRGSYRGQRSKTISDGSAQRREEKQENAGSPEGRSRDSKRAMDGARRPATGLNRTGKSCRLRWVNYLHPGLKRGRMTPQEEQLVLELHARWGNRWSRIALKLPGRTDNEIKNYWRTHMRKKAQERKKNASPSSSSSSLSCLSCLGEPPLEVENKRFESSSLTTAYGGNIGVKGYPMDQIWSEIDTSEAKEVTRNIPFPPIPSPAWEYTSGFVWKMDDEELKMFNPIDDDIVDSTYLNGEVPYG